MGIDDAGIVADASPAGSKALGELDFLGAPEAAWILGLAAYIPERGAHIGSWRGILRVSWIRRWPQEVLQ